MLTRLLRFWLDVSAPIDRVTYLINGLTLAAVKYLGDVALVWLATHRVWMPANYFESVYSLVTTQIDSMPIGVVLAAWTLPFLFLGVTLTLRRLFDAGLSGWFALLFFVPYANYILMAVLCMLPGKAPRESDRAVAREGKLLQAVIPAVMTPVVLASLAMLVIVKEQQAYTVGLFFGTPLLMGALSGFLLNRRYDATPNQTLSVTVLTFVVAGFTALLLATEGAVCILLAFPLATVAGIIGAAIGRTIGRSNQPRLPPAFYAIAFVSMSTYVGPPTRDPGVYEVRSSVEIAATPDEVWPHVIAFDPIAEPADWLFRLGVAYPRRARIDGGGVGAIRYCEFSTGAFVEPITVWEPGRRLSFDVRDQPAPLRELTPYAGVSPPHLDGYVRARRGEFRLVALPGGRSRLEGSTWYSLDIAPAPYWRVFGDYAIRRIHTRVLAHIKSEVEGKRRAEGRQGAGVAEDAA